MHLYICLYYKHWYYVTDVSVVFTLTTDLIGESFFAAGWVCETLYFVSQQSSILHSAVTVIYTPFSNSLLKVNWKYTLGWTSGLVWAWRPLFPFFNVTNLCVWASTNGLPPMKVTTASSQIIVCHLHDYVQIIQEVSSHSPTYVFSVCMQFCDMRFACCLFCQKTSLSFSFSVYVYLCMCVWCVCPVMFGVFL